MKKSAFFMVLLPLLLVMAALSCKSTPAQPPAPAPAEKPASPAPSGKPSQASLDALNKAIARAEAARKQAADFAGNDYFPSEWESAEAQYAGAESKPRSTGVEVDQAALAYNAVADAYDAIFGKAIPLYAQAREDEIIAARDAVIASGLRDSFPEYLSKADGTALQALDQYEARDYYAARDSAASALRMYQLLKTAADAWLVRQDIIGRNFNSYDPDNFDNADSTIVAAMDQYMAGNMDAAQDGAAEALLRYIVVLKTGWARYAAERGASADVERQAALELKANVAVRDVYNEADSVFKQASDLLSSEDYEEAAKRYTESEAMFVVASLAAAEKRRTAADAIKEAEEKIEASDETARQAENLIEGGTR
jgi:hypothetical protein